MSLRGVFIMLMLLLPLYWSFSIAESIPVIDSGCSGSPTVCAASIAQAAPLSPLKRTTRCEKHPQYEINYYCQDCKEVFCAECVIDNHSGHRVVKLETLSKPLKDEILAGISKMKPFDTELSQAIEETKIISAQIDEQAETTEGHLHKVFEKFRTLLNEREAQLKEEIEEKRSQKQRELMMQRIELESLLKEIRDAVGFSEELLKEGNSMAIAASHRPVIERFETLENEMKKAALTPLTDEVIEFVGVEEAIQGMKIRATNDKQVFRRDYSQVGDLPLVEFGSEGERDGQFKSPSSVACNAKGDIIVAEYSNHRIQVFDRNGNFLFKFGSIGNGNGQFNIPEGVTVDHCNNNQIVVADTQNHRIQIFDERGGFLRSFGSYGNEDGQFSSPRGVVVDQTNGNYFVTDFHNHRVQVFNSEGKFIRKIGSKGNGNGQSNAPYGIGLLSNGNVVVREWHNNRLQIFTPEGQFVRMIGNADGQLKNPGHLFVDSDDNILVADCFGHRIQVFNQNGHLVKSIGSGQLSYPSGVSMDSAGRIVVSEYENRISIF